VEISLKPLSKKRGPLLGSRSSFAGDLRGHSVFFEHLLAAARYLKSRSSAVGAFLGIEHRETGDACRCGHFVLQYVSMLNQLAALNPQNIDHNLRLVRPPADPTMDRDEVAISDDQARLVVDGR
jgi:hypothetical protein